MRCERRCGGSRKQGGGGFRGARRRNDRSICDEKRKPAAIMAAGPISMARGRLMKIGDWRRRIDEIDRKLVELLNERSRCALEIGKIKHAERNNSGPLTDAAIRRLFERIIDEARAVERDAMDEQGEGSKEAAE